MINASILTIGDEILLGQIIDTNSAFISKTLSSIGLDVIWQFTVGDSEDRMNEALEMAFRVSDVVFVTGGLGPTRDDLTKKVLAKWFDSPIKQNSQALKDLEELLTKRGRPINPMTLTQADQPTKAEYIQNKIGTAPGMWFFENKKHCISMPGVPYEMTLMLTNEIVPRLKQRLKLEPILHRFIRTIGIAESNLAMKIENWEMALPNNLRLAYLPSGGQVKLRLTGRGENEEKLAEELDQQIRNVLPLIEEYTYAIQDQELEDITGELMVRRGLPVEFDDQITGGHFRSKLLQINGLDVHLNPNEIEKSGLKVHFSQTNREETGFDYLLEAELTIKLENGEVQKTSKSRQLNAFLQPEVNRNIVSLMGFDLIRRLILEIDSLFPKNNQ